MTSSLVTFQNAVLTTLSADPRLSGVHVYAHGGDFNLEELLRYARQTPALVFAITGVDVEPTGGTPLADVTCTLMVVAADRPASPRDLKAMTLVDAVCQILCRFPNQDWNLDEVNGKPKDVKAANAYSAKVNQQGIAMWCVAWHQLVTLATFPEMEITDEFQTLHAQWDLSPRENSAALGDVIEAEDDILP